MNRRKQPERRSHPRTKSKLTALADVTHDTLRSAKLPSEQLGEETRERVKSQLEELRSLPAVGLPAGYVEALRETLNTYERGLSEGTKIASHVVEQMDSEYRRGFNDGSLSVSKSTAAEWNASVTKAYSKGVEDGKASAANLGEGSSEATSIVTPTGGMFFGAPASGPVPSRPWHDTIWGIWLLLAAVCILVGVVFYFF